MQPAREFQQRCRVARKFAGRAHLVEQPYDPEFTAWFGSVAVEIEAARWEELARQDVALDFQDGRCGEGYVVRTANAQEAPADAGQRPVIYFVGVTTLAVPHHPAAPSPPPAP
jgi:hypothetical protein